MLLIESEFKTIDFQEEDALLVTRWKPTSSTLDEPTFKEQILIWLDTIKTHCPQKLFIDTTKFNFIITPEIQQWFDDQIFTAYPDAGVQKKAFLMPEDLFAQVGIQQATQAPKNLTFKVNYFDDEQKAMDWLNAS